MQRTFNPVEDVRHTHTQKIIHTSRGHTDNKKIDESDHNSHRNFRRGARSDRKVVRSDRKRKN